MSEDLEEQLIEKLRSKCFAIQINEATECSSVDHSIAYVQYVSNND
jgi:hypothetical protein